MEIEKQATSESQIEHTLLSKQHDNTDVIIISDAEEEEATLEPKKKKPMLRFPRDNIDELSKVVKALPETKEDNDVASIADLCFPSSYLSEKKTEEKNDDNVIESTISKKKYGHVSLDDLGVSVEDLKSIPWEAFDPTWEIRSWAFDQWLGGHIEDMFSPQNNSDN